MVDASVTQPRLAASLEEPVARLSDVVADSFPNTAFSLTVFGRALTGDFEPQRNPVQCAVVLERIELPGLRRLARHGLRLGKTGLNVPLLMTPAHIASSLDSFPLELLEIQQLHVTVRGINHFANLSFEPTNVRLQCERELKRVLIGMRQGLVAGAGRDNVLAMVMQDAAQNLLRTIRGLLWLRGEKTYKPDTNVIVALEKACNREFPGLRSVTEASPVFDDHEFDELYNAVEGLSDLANAW